MLSVDSLSEPQPAQHTSISAILRYLREKLKQRRIQLILGLILVSLILVLVLYLQRGAVLEALEKLRQLAIAHRTEAALIIIALLILVSFPPIPGYGTILVVSGFLFGTWFGWLVNIIGASIGASLCFLASRWIGSRRSHDNRVVASDSTQNLTGTAPSWSDQLQRYLDRQPNEIWKILILLRMGSLPYSWVSLTLGQMSSVPFWKYFVVTEIALIKTLVHAFIGSTLGDLQDIFASPAKHWPELVVAILSAVLTAITAYYMYELLQKALSEDSDVAVEIESIGNDNGSQ
jgi:uncharacterized membrane protein YdjX (TVP38/TMEM64 family)